MLYIILLFAINSGVRPDVIDEEADLEKYDIVFSPLMITLDQGNLRERIAKWVENGGIWISGPMTDIRTKDGTRFTDRLHGMLEDLTPAVFKYWFPDREKSVKAKWKDGEIFSGNAYYEIFEPNEKADMVTVTESHKEIVGGSVMQCFSVGKGFVYVLGTMPDEKDMNKLITMVCEKANTPCNITEGNGLIVSNRKGRDTEGVILVDVGGKGGKYHNKTRYKDIISDRIFENDISLEPYEVMVLEKL